MTRAELRDMRLRAIAGVALTEREQLGLIEASEQLVEASEQLVEAVGPLNPTSGECESSYTLGTIGREAINIVKQVRFS